MKNIIISRTFIEENMTGDLYFTMLEETIDPLVTVELDSQIASLPEDLLHFQGRRATPHYYLP